MVAETAVDAASAPDAVLSKPVKPDANGSAEGAHNTQQATGESSARRGRPSQAAEDSNEPWRRRLWFVRMPKPPEVPEIKAGETELQTYRAQLAVLSDTLSLKKLERDAARDQTRAARDAFNECRRVFDERRASVNELRRQADVAGEEVAKLRESFKDLEARSEKELDDMVSKLTFRMQHESIPLNEEKRILAQLKKLEAQRERVRECEASGGLLEDGRQRRKELMDQWGEHNNEIKLLADEKNTAHAILEKFREQEAALDAQVEELMAERRRLREAADEVHGRVGALRATQKAKNDDYYENRRFSRRIREVLAEGRLDEARQMCTEQMAAAHVRLAAEPEWRAEYLQLWEGQRRPAPEEEEAAASAEEGGKGKGGRKAKPAKAGGKEEAAAAAAPAEPAAKPARKAEAVIAAVLEEAKEELRRAKAAADAAAAAQAEATAAASAAAAAAASAGAFAGAAKEEQPSLPVGAESEKPAPSSRPPRPHKHHAPPAVEPVVVPEDSFEVPEALRLKERTPSAEELKALERERNARAFAEAERRKQRRAAEKERKRQRGLAEAAARAAAGLPPQPGAAAGLGSGLDSSGAASSEGGSEADAAEPHHEGGVAAASGEAPAAAAATPAASSSGSLHRSGSAGRLHPKNLPAPLKVIKAMDRKPAARRPKEALPKQAVRWLRRQARHEATLLGGVVLLALLLLVSYVVPYFMSRTTTTA